MGETVMKLFNELTRAVKRRSFPLREGLFCQTAVTVAFPPICTARLTGKRSSLPLRLPP